MVLAVNKRKLILDEKVVENKNLTTLQKTDIRNEFIRSRIERLGNLSKDLVIEVKCSVTDVIPIIESKDGKLISNKIVGANIIATAPAIWDITITCDIDLLNKVRKINKNDKIIILCNTPHVINSNRPIRKIASAVATDIIMK
ncbi:MAG: hypothetical protein AABY32_01095 [Nanoarchaeota archaeon]